MTICEMQEERRRGRLVIENTIPEMRGSIGGNESRDHTQLQRVLGNLVLGVAAAP